ncbi:MAG: hypothetical protein KC713_07625, partial [Candidatus Omnitrophica bacterium]|nr:hypothetical protein [Candidatus Omnitrophota bacterium]
VGAEDVDFIYRLNENGCLIEIDNTINIVHKERLNTKDALRYIQRDAIGKTVFLVKHGFRGKTYNFKHIAKMIGYNSFHMCGALFTINKNRFLEKYIRLCATWKGLILGLSIYR